MKTKIKIDKHERVYHDGERGVLSNGHWLVLTEFIEPADAEMRALVNAGKSFDRHGGSFVFEDMRLPKMDELLPSKKGDVLNETSHARIIQNGYAHEFKRENRKGQSFWIRDRYAQMGEQAGTITTIEGMDDQVAVWSYDDRCAAVIMAMNLK